VFWTKRLNKQKTRGYSAKVPRHRLTPIWMAGSIFRTPRAYLQNAQAEGVWVVSDRTIWFGRCWLDDINIEPVCDHGPRIPDQRSDRNNEGRGIVAIWSVHHSTNGPHRFPPILLSSLPSPEHRAAVPPSWLAAPWPEHAERRPQCPNFD
jgi:hypothetical protein